MCVFTRSLPASLAFWGALGLRVLARGERDALLGLPGAGARGGAGVTLHLRAADDEAVLSRGYGPLLSLAVRDVPAAVPALLAAGAALDGPVRFSAAAGAAALLRSPDGVMLELSEEEEGDADGAGGADGALR